MTTTKRTKTTDGPKEEQQSKRQKTSDSSVGTVEICHQVAFKNVKSEDVYEALVNEKVLSEWTHAPATIKEEVGSKFTLYGDRICGEITELVKNQRIGQKWRWKEFPENHYSEVHYTISTKGDETMVELTQRGVPRDSAPALCKFWFTSFWEQLEKFFKSRQSKQAPNAEVLVPRHIDIPVQDMERAVKFYSNGFGWKTQKTNLNNRMSWVADGGIIGGFFETKEKIHSSKNASVYFSVVPSESLDATVERLVKLGAKLLEKVEVPKTGWLATMQDTEGNVFGVWKPMQETRPQ
jgi:predicted enzyme related to lactoylglutathione lyase/uncharacterized protein YndB with AHSA1/START domain